MELPVISATSTVSYDEALVVALSHGWIDEQKKAFGDDVRARLDADPVALAFFETLNSVNRYAILYCIQDAEKPETRARRIDKFVEMLSAHQQIPP
jgi:uncharacterized protein YdeI (YjbR/CyaY-like superfamily)